jgi:hypothetical protein
MSKRQSRLPPYIDMPCALFSPLRKGKTKKMIEESYQWLLDHITLSDRPVYLPGASWREISNAIRILIRTANDGSYRLYHIDQESYTPELAKVLTRLGTRLKSPVKCAYFVRMNKDYHGSYPHIYVRVRFERSGHEYVIFRNRYSKYGSEWRVVSAQNGEPYYFTSLSLIEAGIHLMENPHHFPHFVNSKNEKVRRLVRRIMKEGKAQ